MDRFGKLLRCPWSW
jgi:hypothetical protein